MHKNKVALMIFGEPRSTRNALTEEKYKRLASHFSEKGFSVDSVLYHDSIGFPKWGSMLKTKTILTDFL